MLSVASLPDTRKRNEGGKECDYIGDDKDVKILMTPLTHSRVNSAPSLRAAQVRTPPDSGILELPTYSGTLVSFCYGQI